MNITLRGIALEVEGTFSPSGEAPYFDVEAVFALGGVDDIMPLLSSAALRDIESACLVHCEANPHRYAEEEFFMENEA